MKALFYLILAFFLNLAFVAAEINVDVLKESYATGETVQAKVQMENFAVSKLSLLDANGNKVGVGFFFLELGNNTYFVYFDLPPSMQTGTYTLYISDRRIVEGRLEELNGTDSFDVVTANSAFSIKPAIVKLDPKSSSFKIELKHVYGNTIKVNISATDKAIKPAREVITLEPLESKYLFSDYIFKELSEDSWIILSFDNRSYNIPIIVPVEEVTPVSNITENITEIENVTSEATIAQPVIIFVNNLNVIKHRVAQNITIAGPLRFKSTSKLHNVSFHVSPELEQVAILNVSMFPEFLPGKVYVQYMWLNKNKDVKPGSYYGRIFVESAEGAAYSIPLELTFEEAEKKEAEKEVTIKPIVNISVGQFNLTIVNYSELKEEKEKRRTKSLMIAIALILFVLIAAALLAYRLRPKKGYIKMEEYIKELKAPAKKRK